MVRALPRPSSSENLSDCNDASIGKTVEAATLPLMTSARWLLKSTATAGRLTFAIVCAGRSFFTLCDLFSGIAAENSCGLAVVFEG
jgi:hypothetical protein